MDKLVVSPREAAKALSMSLASIYPLIEEGQIEAYKDGSYWKVSVKGMQKYVDRRVKEERRSR